MIVGIPKEIKRDEYRVGLLPVGVEELVRAGHRVLVEAGAGLGSGLADHNYLEHGAELVAGSERIYGEAELVVKVKEPQAEEIPRLRKGQVVFTYFHFAADRKFTEAVLATGCTAVAYETLRDDRGRLPLLTPMSEVAGRMSIQEGAKYLERPQMGRGILLGGVPGVAPAHIAILGGGVVGCNAAKVAAGFGANVALMDIDMDRLRYLDDIMPSNVNVLFSDRHTIREQLRLADLVIGSVLVPGARAPVLIEETDLRLMKPGSVYEVTINLYPTANLFKRGHRLRVDISSSNFPHFDVNPNTGEPLQQHRRLIPADNTVYHDARYASHILLPIIPPANTASK